MSEKTEQPTPKRVQDARKKGQVFRSQDIVQALVFVTAAAVLAFAGASFGENLSGIVSAAMASAPTLGSAPPDALFQALADAWHSVILIPLPLMVAVFAVAGLANFLQVGANFTIEPLMPKLEKLNPVEASRTFFSACRLGSNSLRTWSSSQSSSSSRICT